MLDVIRSQQPSADVVALQRRRLEDQAQAWWLA